MEINLLAVCAVIITLGGSGAVIYKVFAPLIVMNKRINALEDNSRQWDNRMTQFADGVQILLKTTIAILDSQIQNNPKLLEPAKEELNSYLVSTK